MLSIKILGAHSPFCKKNQACPSYLIKKANTQILLDCGSGSHRFFNMNKLERLQIFISHLHKDHFNDIFNYLYSSITLKNQRILKDKLKVYLPEFESDISRIIKSEPNAYADYFEIKEGIEYIVDDFKISFCKLDHSHQVEMYAIKLKTENICIIYSGDVSFASKDKLIEFSKNADMLICEASLLKEHNFSEICAHLTASQAAEIAKCSGVKKLLLTHFWPNENKEKYLLEAKEIFDNVMLAEEENEIFL